MFIVDEGYIRWDIDSVFGFFFFELFVKNFFLNFLINNIILFVKMFFK